VTGDAVNVAARLEQHATPGEVLLGENTFRLVRHAVDLEPVEPLQLKGKAERVKVWRLLAAREVTAPSPRSLASLMVGRERQLAQLRQAYDAAVEALGCQLFTLLGSAGVGKSRLVEEFISGLGDGATVLLSRCLPTARASATTRSSRRSSKRRTWPTSTCPRSSRPRSARCSKVTSTRRSRAATSPS
jgi:AAA ATPase domain